MPRRRSSRCSSRNASSLTESHANEGNWPQSARTSCARLCSSAHNSCRSASHRARTASPHLDSNILPSNCGGRAICDGGITAHERKGGHTFVESGRYFVRGLQVNGEARRSLKSALMAGAALATAVGIAPASAQDQPVEKVVVTGSRIPQKGLTSISPVSTITSTEARLQGTTTAETLLNNLPQVFANQGAQASNGTSGTSTVDLRALGPKRTMVLVNGRRLHPANLLAPTADLNTIPMPMLERVEVLTGGASAVYGADAVAGVVNFILRKNI